MKLIVTIMQPYLFPYVGYFQLLECSDIFVIHDDVQYIKGGWINRNRILVNNAQSWLTLPIKSASFSLLINQRIYAVTQSERNKILQRIESNYRKAPHFLDIFPFIVEMINYNLINVSEFNTYLIRSLADLLKIKCQIILSSELNKDNSLNGQERVIEINHCLGSTHYVNPIGGTALYREQDFVECGLELSFLQPGNIQYSQFKEPFLPFLSIIDVLMFNGGIGTSKLLTKYDLIKQLDLQDSRGLKKIDDNHPVK